MVDENKEIKGCIKLVFGKGRELNNLEAEYTTACLQRWLFEQKNISNSSQCFVLDVFGKKVFSSSKISKKRMADIETACEEISLTWNIF